MTTRLTVHQPVHRLIIGKESKYFPECGLARMAQPVIYSAPITNPQMSGSISTLDRSSLFLLEKKTLENSVDLLENRFLTKYGVRRCAKTGKGILEPARFPRLFESGKTVP